MTPEPITNDPVNPDPSNRQHSSWDISNAPRNYASLVASQFGSAVFSFGAVWLLTRYLGSEGYGGIIAIIAASQIAQVLVNWTSMAVVRFGVDEYIETEKIARTFWMRLIVVAVNLGLVFSLANIWFPPLAEWLKLSPESFWLVLVHFGVTVIWIHIQMSLQGVKRPRVQGFLMMVERLLIFAGLIVLTATSALTPDRAIICYIAAPALMVIAGSVQLRKYVFASFAIDRLFLRKLLMYSVPLLPFSLVGYFAGGYVDAVFVSKFLSTRDLGVYSVATQINGIALQLPTLANSLLLPLFVSVGKEQSRERMLNYFRNLLPSITIIWGLGCTAIAFTAYFIIPIFFGPEFERAGLPLWILLTASAVSIPALMGFFPLSHAVSATYITMTGAIFAATTNIAGNFILIPKYGLAGCAWATAASYFVNVVVSGVFVERRTGVPLSWNFLAFLPAVAGGFVLTYLANAWLAGSVCFAISIVVIYIYWNSFWIAVRFALSKVRQNTGTPV